MKRFLPLSYTLFLVFGILVSFVPAVRGQDPPEAHQWLVVDPFELALVPPSSGVHFYRDGIVFLSSTASENKMIRNQVSFGSLDARYAELNGSVLGRKKQFSPGGSFPYPCEAVTFSRDYKTMYYTKYSSRDGVEKIYRAEYKGDVNNSGSWSYDREPLSFCSDQYSCSHPALSLDGKLMVFASNQEGSFGGMDLYATIFKNGEWSDPVNLGEAVNTYGNELYPYLDRDNNLYFSSDGIQGFGGYDVYVCKYRKNTWERPINLSTPINTASDDVAFTVNRKDGRTAFYTVKDKAGKRSQYLNLVRMNESVPDTILTLTQYFTNPEISPMVILALEPPVEATNEEEEAERLSEIKTSGGADKIVYRVQFMTSFNPGTRKVITIDGKDYDVFEYLYSGAYRLCTGEFTSLSPAIELQNLLKNNGYPGATVVVFKNNILTLDPELLSARAGNKAVQTGEQIRQGAGADEVKKTEPPPEVKVTEPPPEAKVTEPVPVETAKTGSTDVISEKPAVPKDDVVYRVQILSSTASKGSYQLKMDGNSYPTFEYFYVGAYRTCIGEFPTLAQARELQNSCRRNGYGQAFVVAFKNGKRSKDPALFK